MDELSHVDYLNGKLWVDEFVTHTQTLENINKGFDDMHVSRVPLKPIGDD